jgi:hypothetical protein
VSSFLLVHDSLGDAFQANFKMQFVGFFALSEQSV